MADFTAPSDFTFKHTEQVDVPNISANDMKAYLDSQAKELRDYFINTFLAEIKATTDGAAGADKIGATAIAGVTGGKVQAQIESLATVATATITDTWVGSSAPYTQDVTVAGLTTDHTPVISPVFSATNATAILEKTAWNLIGKIVTGAGKITVTCFEDKPVTAIPIQIKGV